MRADPPAHDAAAIAEEEVQDWLVEHCGKGLPHKTADDLASALHGVAYTLKQIEGTNQYKVFIGQSGPASSGIRWLLEYVARNEIACASLAQSKGEK